MHYLYCLVLSLLLSGCGRPLQLVRVEPADPATVDRYFYGNAIQQEQQAGLTVETNFYDASPEYLIFDVSILNESDGDVLFDPVASMLYTSAQNGMHAIDPEVQVFTLDMDVLHQEKNRRTLNWVGGTLLAASTVYLLVDGSNAADAATTPNTTANTVTDLTLALSDAYWFAVQTSSLSERSGYDFDSPDPSSRFFWLDHSFRRTTIRPGERAVGKLVFPRSDDVTALRLEVWVEDRSFTFPFTQRLYRPGPNRSSQEVVRSLR
ncbi:hypothetical protein LEM8419_01478 [Neolewinella maritima]|uniref:DUF4352 domain-containing protein n=1 Tax=Neolewinella maritima TaxID=1383882 RepID=A0ABM9B0K8_9BACT|nr:hypothetical protein [Neolewinella maritima]CAH1000325.1 hypothetical protein LEM8419_01478 [Neolewinella maritima]